MIGITQNLKPFENDKNDLGDNPDLVILCLYIAGLTPRSTLAVERIRALCEEFLAGRYELKVVDMYLQPEEAKRAHIIVAPTLVKVAPTPLQFFIGDMMEKTAFLRSLKMAG